MIKKTLQTIKKYVQCMNMYKFLFTFTLCMFFISLFGRICLSNFLASENKQLSSYYAQKYQLEKDISKLSYIDASLSSLSNVEKKAQELGFVKMSEPLMTLDQKSTDSSVATIISQ